jgi:uncharacterized HAD superfamily protein
MKIVIDIDEVLADQIPEIIKFFNESYHENLSLEDLDKYVYLGFLGLTKEESKKNLLQFFETPYFRNIKPIDGAIHAIDKLSRNNELIVLTGRPYLIKKDTECWLEQYFPNKFSQIIFNNVFTKETFLPRTGSKMDICREIDAEIFIEDDLFFIQKCPDNLRVLLYDHPWNRKSLPPGVSRVKNWNEILERIEEIQRISIPSP